MYRVLYESRAYTLKQLLHKVKEKTFTNWKVNRKDGLLDPKPRYIKRFQNDKCGLSYIGFEYINVESYFENCWLPSSLVGFRLSFGAVELLSRTQLKFLT